MQAACFFGYHSEECTKVREHLDSEFYKTKTSILNIYKPCYHQKFNSTKKMTQSGRYTKINDDDGSCEDSIGISHFFNEPAIS